MAVCKDCGRNLTNDEIGLYKRVINRGAGEYSCITCLSRFFGCSEEILQKKITHFKEMGCALFAHGK